MSKVSLADLMELSADERIQLAADLWDSVAQREPDALPLTDSQRVELESRLVDYDANPQEGRAWPEVRSQILGEAGA